MLKPDRIQITDENVDALVEQYADVWMTAVEIERTFDGLKRSTIQPWSRAGDIRSREILPRPKHSAWFEYNVADCIVARHKRRRCKPFLRRRKDDGRMEFRCNVCTKWKDEDEFYDNYRKDRDNHGKLTYCKQCHNDRMSKVRAENPEVRERERLRFREKYARQREHMRAAQEWRATAEIDAQKIIDIIDAQFPDDTDRLIAERAGVHTDMVRQIRRRARQGKQSKITSAEKLLIGLDLKSEATRLIDEAWGEQPKWHKDWPYCQKCLRINVTYMAAGLCSTCYRQRNNPDYIPPVETSWSMRYPYCQRCETTERRHVARGLCGKCWQIMRKRGELKPATSGRGAHVRKKVGSGHGIPRSAQEQQATTTGGSRRDDQGRKPSDA